MIAPGKYSTANAFRIALETRLKKVANDEQIDLQRLRRLVAFDRLLARIFHSEQTQLVLKGGYAMELRMKEARTTKDIDFIIEDPKSFLRPDMPLKETIREELQEHVSGDFEDFFVFMIGMPMMDIDAAPYGGARYPVDARLDGRTFVKFHVDVAVGDVVLTPLESIKTRDWLGFAGINPPTVAILSKEQQFSEKLHSYTMTKRGVPNSRVKDLVDMVLFMQQGELDQEKMKNSIAVTFARRKTHEVPEDIAPPADHWRPVFEKLAHDCGLNIDIDGAFKVLKTFYANLKITDNLP